MKKNPKQKEKYENRNQILGSLEGNVAEMENELEEAEEESAEQSVDPVAPMLKNRKTFFAVGIIIIVLAVIGLISTVSFTVDLVGDIAGQTALKNEFAEFLYPMVIIDGPAFDSVEDAPTSVVINAAIWRIILNGDTSKYESDGTNMTVSEIDVESSAVSLFGYGIKIEHQTVGTGDNRFTYDESSKSYIVPVDTVLNTYWPKVSEISSVGESYTVTVEYMPPTMFSANGTEYEQEPDKIMIYTVSRIVSAMNIQSVQYYQGTTL